MKYYTGLDVSMKTTSICIIDQNGAIKFEETVPTDPVTISAVIHATKLDIEKIAIESEYISHWLVQELERRDLPIICIDSRQMSKVLSLNINKTDKNDARLIAEALRCGFYSEVHQKSQDNVETRILINSRRTLKNISVQLKNTIRGHLKAFGVRLQPAGNKKFVELVNETLKDKSKIVQCGIKQLLEAFAHICRQIDQLEKKLEALAENDEDVQLLQTIPGVGLITAFTFKVYLGDPHRFKTSKAVGAYFGMTPRQYSSGETQRHGGVSKQDLRSSVFA